MKELINDILTKRSSVVEIGSGSGIISDLLAQNSFIVHCIDWWDLWGRNKQQTDDFTKVADTYPNVFQIKGDYIAIADEFMNNNIDFVFINNIELHKYKKVITTWLPKIKKGGYIGGKCLMNPAVEYAVVDIFGIPEKVYDDDYWIVKI